MARTPRATVSKTSGQGVSRLAYQQAYRSRNKSSPLDSGPSVSSDSSKASREYGKSSKPKKFEPKTGREFNVSYGDTYHPTDLADIERITSRMGK